MIKIFSYAVNIVLLAILSQSFAQTEKVRRFSKDWKKQGPEKSWNSTEHEYFYKWRNSLLEKRLAKNNQLLRRQKAILNGNKITTEIWNYGSTVSYTHLTLPTKRIV